MKRFMILAALITGSAMALMPDSAEAARVRIRGGWYGPPRHGAYYDGRGYRPYYHGYRQRSYYRPYRSYYRGPGWYGGRRGVIINAPGFRFRYR